MRVFRKKYRRGGKLRQSRCWYVTWRDSFNDLRSTWRGYPTKTATEAYGRNLEALAASRATANLLDADLERWLNSLPTNTLQHLAERKLVEPVRLEAERPLDQHVEAYRQHRIDQRRNANDTCQTVERIKRMNAHAGFRSARDVTLPRIEKAIAKITEKHSTATRNRYGVVYHAFLEWMVDRGLIVANPMKGWKRAAEDANQHRRALDEDEATRLVAAAANGETASGLTRRGAALKRQGKDIPDSEIAWSLTGEDRAMLYRFALETALRSGTIARLTVRDFELAGDEPLVCVGGSVATKERAARTIPLRRETAALLAERFASKLPNASAFPMPPLNRLATLLRDDLEAARAAWVTEARTPEAKAERAESDFLTASDACGRRVDFHALRDTAATWLVRRGVPLASVALITGHRNIATLEKHYLRLDERDARAAINLGRNVELPAARLTRTDEAANHVAGALCHYSPSVGPLVHHKRS